MSYARRACAREGSRAPAATKLRGCNGLELRTLARVMAAGRQRRRNYGPATGWSYGPIQILIPHWMRGQVLERGLGMQHGQSTGDCAHSSVHSIGLYCWSAIAVLL